MEFVFYSLKNAKNPSFRCSGARGKRAAEVSFKHKVMNESRIQSKRNFR
ncbi:hypothetical protein NBRC111894_3219 [Sporolactobacillus inulinus]|uniref:Uncharacterized protein n=1 Tax=Sporolactobacillus inulinus TaxID=2078 RepID=A0A4Y1ZF24_9BACL|nr:hypothetical protein NBRC111894_3219 [Sporolactobacillus inulinus]